MTQTIPALVPRPRTVAMTAGEYTMPACGTIVAPEPDLDGACSRQLADDIRRHCGLEWRRARGVAYKADILLEIDGSLPERAYRLDVDAHAAVAVRVAGGSRRGLRDGVQTLRQLIRQCGPALPCLRIEDEPAYARRGYYLDVTRGRVPTLRHLKAWADRLCLYKYNELQLYVEHAFTFPGLSEMWRGTDALRPDDLMEFDDYCAGLGIELIPSISTFGHLYMALRTRGYAGLGELPQDADRPYSLIERQEHHTLNVADPRSLDFAKRLIDAYVPLFRSRRVNLGCDETFDLGKGASAPMTGRIGVGAAYADFVGALCRHVQERGGEPMIWADIALQHPDILDRLPDGVTLLNWNYAPLAGPDGFEAVARSGAEQMVCPAVLGWNALVPRIDGAWSNIARVAAYGRRVGAAGMLVTDWGDFGHVQDPRLCAPGMMMGAECAWGGGVAPSDGGAGEGGDVPPAPTEVLRRISRAAYGDPDFVGLLRDAAAQATFGWHELVYWVELDQGDGTVNPDVAAAADAGRPEGGEPVAGAGDLPQARRRYCAPMRGRLLAAGACNEALDAIRTRIGHALAGMRESARTDVATAALLAVEGQRLLNEAGLLLVRSLDAEPADVGSADVEPADTALAAAESSDADSTGPHPTAAVADGERAADLAGSIECWWEAYRRNWRAVSRESELARADRIVWRLADELRAL